MPVQQQQRHQCNDDNGNITHTNVLKHFDLSHVDVGSSLRWLSASTMTKSHHFVSTSDPKPHNHNPSQVVDGCNCLRLLLYANGQHINVLKHIAYVYYGWGKQFEVAVSLNLDVMTSF